MDVVQNFVKNTMLINDFSNLAKTINADIIPIKGMALLLSIYKDNIGERMLSDIDILISEKDLETVVEGMYQNGYVMIERMFGKGRYRHRKTFTFHHTENKKCDIDVHTCLVTNKFFRDTIGNFNEDTLRNVETAQYNNLTIKVLSPIYNWIFLAQHYCFHLFCKKKWLHDLYVIQNSFSQDQIDELCKLVKQYNMERVYNASVSHLLNEYGANVKLPLLDIHHSLLFRRYLSKKFDVTKMRKTTSKILGAFCEFTFISKAKDRFKQFLRLLFPSMDNLRQIYSITSVIVLILMYPVNFVIVLLFSLIYCMILIAKK